MITTLGHFDQAINVKLAKHVIRPKLEGVHAFDFSEGKAVSSVNKG